MSCAMACPKEKEVLFKMINIYRDMPYLWQKSHKDYLNHSLRLEGFRVLLEMYKDFDKKATIKTIKKKMMNMRSNYNKELAKVNSSKTTGAGTNEVYIPSLWYFDALNFIGSRSESCRPTVETIEDDEDSHSSDEDISSQQSRRNAPMSQQNEPTASTSSGHTIKKKKETLLQKQEKFMKSAEALLSKEEEDWEVFGKSVGLQLKNVSGTQLVFAQKIISDVIYNAKLCRLSEDSSLLVAPRTEEPTVNRNNCQMPLIQSPASTYCSTPSPYNPQSPELPHKRPSSRNHPFHTQSSRSSSSSTQYHPSPYYSQSQLHTVELQQHQIQPQLAVIQSPQHGIQSPKPESQQNRIYVNNSEEFLRYIDNEPSNNNFSPPIIEESANIMKQFLIFKHKKE